MPAESLKRPTLPVIPSPGNGLERLISDDATMMRPLIESEANRDGDGQSVPLTDPDVAITQTEMIAARRRLQRHHQAVLEMQCIHKMSQAQVAEEIGVPLRAVKVVSLNALRSLSQEIAEARERDPGRGSGL